MTSTKPAAPAARRPAERTGAEPVPGEGRRARSGHVTSYGGGRTCAVAGCATILSMYNHGTSCSGHPVSGGGHGTATTNA